MIECLNNDIVRQFMCATQLAAINFKVNVKNVLFNLLIVRFSDLIFFFFFVTEYINKRS